jgi:2-dehydropantoate 2-reductase
VVTAILANRGANRPLESSVHGGAELGIGLARGNPTPISDEVVPMLAFAG